MTAKTLSAIEDAKTLSVVKNPNSGSRCSHNPDNGFGKHKNTYTINLPEYARPE